MPIKVNGQSVKPSEVDDTLPAPSAPALKEWEVCKKCDEQGYQAYLAGKPRESNPYTTQVLVDAWNRGWDRRRWFETVWGVPPQHQSQRNGGK